MIRETSPAGQLQQYKLFFFYHLLQLVLWSVLQSSRAWRPRFILLKTPAAVALASLQPVRASWIPYQRLYHESVRIDVRWSKRTLWSWWIKLLRIYDLVWLIWYERHSTQNDPSFLTDAQRDLLLAFSNSMIRMCNICVAHPPCDLKRVWYFTLAALRKNQIIILPVQATNSSSVFKRRPTQLMDLGFIYFILTYLLRHGCSERLATTIGIMLWW